MGGEGDVGILFVFEFATSDLSVTMFISGTLICNSRKNAARGILFDYIFLIQLRQFSDQPKYMLLKLHALVSVNCDRIGYASKRGKIHSKNTVVKLNAH